MATDIERRPDIEPVQWLRGTARLGTDVYKAARTRGEVPVCRQIDAMARQMTGRAVVAVVGERSRGKSRLINAIVERSNVLPVDTDVTTNAYIALVPARAGDEHAVVEFADPDRPPQRVALDELDEYANEEHNPHNDLGVRSVVVHVSSPQLARGLDLLDTPGVGGLVGAHGELALAAIGEADGLLMVLDASGQITEPEIAFLERASAETNRVVLALTKADAYRGERSELPEIVRAALRGPLADSPIVVVSALEAERALEMMPNDADYGRRLVQRSGMRNLIAALRTHLVGPIQVEQGEEMLARAGRGLNELARADREVIAATEGVTDPALRLEAIRAELGGLPRDMAAPLDKELREARSDAQDDLEDRLTRARHELRRKIDAEFSEELRAELPRLYDTTLEAIWRGACEGLQRETAAVAERLAERYDLHTSGSDSTELVAGGEGEQLPEAARPLYDPPKAVGTRKEKTTWLRSLAYVLRFRLLLTNWSQRRNELKRADQSFALEWLETSLGRARSRLRRELAKRATQYGGAARDTLEPALRARVASLQRAERALANIGDSDIEGVRTRINELTPLGDRIRELMASKPGG